MDAYKCFEPTYLNVYILEQHGRSRQHNSSFFVFPIQAWKENAMNEKKANVHVRDYLSQQLNEKGCVSKSEFKILFWVIQKFLRFPDNTQPQHMDYIDELLAQRLRSQGFSYGDIAFVLDRSKSSVFEYLKPLERFSEGWAWQAAA